MEFNTNPEAKMSDSEFAYMIEMLIRAGVQAERIEAMKATRERLSK